MGVDTSALAVFLHSGDYDRLHQGLSIAATAAAAGRRVHVFLFWWALERLVRGPLDEHELPGREDVAARMEARGAPTLAQLLEAVRASGTATLHACTGSMAALGLTPPEVEAIADQLVGWTTILGLTRELPDRFYL